MSKSKFQTVYGVRIYPIDYLMSAELTESDLNHLFDTNSLLYSVIIGMYRYIGSKKQNGQMSNLQILKINLREYLKISIA